MSLLGKKWVVQNNEDDLNITEKVLKNRNLHTKEEQSSFFDGGKNDIHDPFLLSGMEKSVERIRIAIEKGEKVMIFGDYDVDGITSTAILYTFLKKVGVDVHKTLPHRENDGYGLKDYFIKQFKEDSIDLIITVDCGVSNFKEIELANSLGMTVIVTDHHTVPEKLPNAYSIINPHQKDCKYPNKDACGAMVAYKLVRALAPYFFEINELSEHLKSQLTLVALGTISDCMVLTDENRVLTKKGIECIQAGYNPGIIELLESDGMSTDNINSTTVGFYIGPRLNAAGRLDTADHSFDLLTGNLEKASTLNELNTTRKEIVVDYLKQAMEIVDNEKGVPNLIVVINKEWRPGTLGLIAGRLVERYNRPSIAMQDRGDELVASCRSLNDFDITGFLRSEVGELFSAFGGHKLAGGFSLPKKNLEKFLNHIKKVASEKIDISNFINILDIECEIKPEEISFETKNYLSKLEPFGRGNPEPTLVIRNVKLLGMRAVGKEKDHLQFPVQIKGESINAIAFRLGEHIEKIDIKKPHDIAFNLDINEWNGRKKLQLRVVDIKESINY